MSEAKGKTPSKSTVLVKRDFAKKSGRLFDKAAGVRAGRLYTALQYKASSRRKTGIKPQALKIKEINKKTRQNF